MANSNRPRRPFPTEIYCQIFEILGQNLFKPQIINLFRTEQDLIVTNRADIHQRNVWDLFRDLRNICPEAARYVDGILNNSTGFQRTLPMISRNDRIFQGLYVDYQADIFRLPDDLISFAAIEAAEAARMNAQMQPFEDTYDDFSYTGYTLSGAPVFNPDSSAFHVTKLMANLTSLEELLRWATPMAIEANARMNNGEDFALERSQPGFLDIFRPFFDFKEVIILVDIQETCTTTPAGEEVRTVVKRPLDHLSWDQLQYVRTFSRSQDLDEEEEEEEQVEGGLIVKMGMSRSVAARCSAVHTDWYYMISRLQRGNRPLTSRFGLASQFTGPDDSITSTTLGLAFISER